MANPEPPKCPRCAHPVKMNVAKCGGCGVVYHELCLKQGCACGGVSTDQRDLVLPAGYALAVAGVVAAAVLRGAKATGATTFWPAAALGAVGFVVCATRKIKRDDAKGFGRTAAQLMAILALAVGAVAVRGAAFPFFFAAIAFAAVALAVSAFAVIADVERMSGAMALLLGFELYLVAAISLPLDFPRAAYAEAMAKITGMPAAVATGSPGGTASPVPAFVVSGVMKVAGKMQAMTNKGAFAVGASIPDVGTVKSITDDEVVVLPGSGGEQKYPIGH